MESKKKIIVVDIPPSTIDLGYSKINFSYDEYDNLKMVWGSENSSEFLTFLIPNPFPKKVLTRKEIAKQFLKDFFKK